ncbi:MAG: HlyD family efflux transporter periplasmic adaptor subunit [Patescibacteria group bacterium]|nr:HlyD family efflux transporter periplasmic adaptor subunit [Patescibacteria group bacterium]
MKKFVIPLIIVTFVSLFAYQVFFRKTESEFTLVEVVRGNILQEVSETGQVKKGEKINLSFKSTGIVEKIYVETSNEVETGDLLAKLENDQLKIQLKESKANLELYQAQLNKLLAGSTQEEIQIAQTEVDNAKISLDIAKQTLEDIEAQRQDDLKADYEDALNVVDDAYLKISNAKNSVDLIQAAYFNSNDQESILVKENQGKIQTVLDQIKPYLDTARLSQKDEDIDIALSEMKRSLKDTFDYLGIIRETCESINYKNVVSSTDKASLDTQRGYINTVLTSVVNSEQTISSTKLTNTTNINTKQGEINKAEGKLKAAQDALNKITASPRKEDIDLNQAQVRQAAAKVQLLEKQIEDTILKSPVKGQVISINKRIGEIAQTTLQDVVISILPTVPFEIEVDIYEEDVVKVDIGDEVDISLVPFPERVLKGKVFSIGPAEKMIEGVVYYEVSVGFNEMLEGMKPGMTADLIIKTAFMENVLIIPEITVKEKDGKRITRVLEGANIKEREIRTGLEGNDGMIEVISGLNEGERVVMP